MAQQPIPFKYFGPYVAPPFGPDYEADYLVPHPDLMVNGTRFKTKDLGLSPFTQSLHYGTTVISGMGCWKGADGKYRIFRLRDHVERFVNNLDRMLMLLLPGEMTLPAELLNELRAERKAQLTGEIMQGVQELAGNNLKYLVKSDHLYIRLFAVEAAQSLGVGTCGRLQWWVITRDLTPYLPAGKRVDLLVPGSVFRRPNPMSGTSDVKVGANYALPFAWKARMIHRFGCDEVLATTDDGEYMAESSGSIGIVKYEAGHVGTPPPNSWGLPGISKITCVDELLKAMGVDTVQDESIPMSSICSGKHNLALMGTWTLVADVGRLCVHTGPPPDESVFTQGNGAGFADWLINNFRPEWVELPPAPELLINLARLYRAALEQDYGVVNALIADGHLPSGYSFPDKWYTTV